LPSYRCLSQFGAQCAFGLVLKSLDSNDCEVVAGAPGPNDPSTFHKTVNGQYQLNPDLKVIMTAYVSHRVETRIAEVATRAAEATAVEVLTLKAISVGPSHPPRADMSKRSTTFASDGVDSIVFEPDSFPTETEVRIALQTFNEGDGEELLQDIALRVARSRGHELDKITSTLKEEANKRQRKRSLGDATSGLLGLIQRINLASANNEKVDILEYSKEFEAEIMNSHAYEVIRRELFNLNNSPCAILPLFLLLGHMLTPDFRCYSIHSHGS